MSSFRRSGKAGSCLRTLAGLAGAIGLSFLQTPASAQAQAQAEDPMAALFSDLPTEPAALAAQIIQDVAAIRGLGFLEEIAVTNQSLEDFERYLDAEMSRAMPPERSAAFGRVINKLGLYSGPVIEDTEGLIKFVMTSQAAAYYDPKASAFYVLLGDAPMLMLAPIYAHELYHGLQDQYWDLDAYLLDANQRGLNDDETLARQAVVEGEATYIMTLWMMRQMTGETPSGFMLDMAVNMQAQLDGQALQEMVESQMVPDMLGEGMADAAAAMDQIPPFMLETMIGAYLKGMGFVHAIMRDGWESVELLYTDPPRSTEQILHPEKWLDRDDPVAIEFRDLDRASVLDDWELLDSNVIGELQWRIIFSEFGMSDRAAELAAGWDGDRFGVFERDGELLLLLYTTWDTEADAAEFAQAYIGLLDAKYPDQDELTMVELRDQDVLIVEGGESDDARALLRALSRSRKIE